jgi:hypothetical protein
MHDKQKRLTRVFFYVKINLIAVINKMKEIKAINTQTVPG